MSLDPLNASVVGTQLSHQTVLRVQVM